MSGGEPTAEHLQALSALGLPWHRPRRQRGKASLLVSGHITKSPSPRRPGFPSLPFPIAWALCPSRRHSSSPKMPVLTQSPPRLQTLGRPRVPPWNPDSLVEREGPGPGLEDLRRLTTAAYPSCSLPQADWQPALLGSLGETEQLRTPPELLGQTPPLHTSAEDSGLRAPESTGGLPSA